MIRISPWLCVLALIACETNDEKAIRKGRAGIAEHLEAYQQKLRTNVVANLPAAESLSSKSCSPDMVGSDNRISVVDQDTLADVVNPSSPTKAAKHLPASIATGAAFRWLATDPEMDPVSFWFWLYEVKDEPYIGVFLTGDSEEGVVEDGTIKKPASHSGWFTLFDTSSGEMVTAFEVSARTSGAVVKVKRVAKGKTAKFNEAAMLRQNLAQNLAVAAQAGLETHCPQIKLDTINF